MDSKYIESIVAAEEVLQLRGIVACNATAHTENDGSPGRHKARSRRDGNQSSNNAGAEAHSRPFSFQAVVNKAPGDASNASRKVGNNGSHYGTEVSRKSRASVETKPSHPEEDGSDDNVGDVMGAVVKFLCTVAPSLSEHVRVSQRCATRRDMNGSASSKVKSTHF